MGLEFLQAHGWGQGSDRQEDYASIPGGYKYCARGALIYGAFADETEHAWCPDRADWHKGPCVEAPDVCDNSDQADPADWIAARGALDDGATVVGGRWMVSVEYNDAIGRTKSEVEGMFEAAIKLARSRDE